MRGTDEAVRVPLNHDSNISCRDEACFVGFLQAQIDVKKGRYLGCVLKVEPQIPCRGRMTAWDAADPGTTNGPTANERLPHLRRAGACFAPSKSSVALNNQEQHCDRPACESLKTPNKRRPTRTTQIPTPLYSAVTVIMSAEKRPADDDAGSSRMLVKRQNVNSSDSALARLNASNSSLVQAVSGLRGVIWTKLIVL